MVVPLLNIPIISVVLLLLAGILIGHLIWYRDRSDDEATLVDLRSENNELQSALHEHKQAYVDLESTLEDRKKGWDQLKAANQQLEQTQQSANHDLSEINNELARLQQLKDQAFHDLDQERQQRRALQDALGKAEENTTRATSLTAQLQSQIASFDMQNRETEDRAHFLAERADLEEQLRSQIDAVTEERNALTRERDALLHRLEAGRDDAQVISALQSQTETLRKQVNESEASLAQLQSQNKQYEEDLSSIRNERDNALQEAEDERAGRGKIEQQLQNVDQLVAQRDEAITRAEKLGEELSQSRLRVSQLSENLEGTSQEMQLLQTSHEDAKLEIKQETDVLRQKLASLSQEHEAVSQVLIDERSRLSSMESENHRLSSMAADAEAKAVSNNEELRSSVARKQVEIDTLRTELEDVASQLSRERHQREHLQTVLHEQKADTSKFDEERKQFELQVNSLSSKNESLLSQAAELLSLRGVHSAAESQIAALTSELSNLRQQQDSTHAERTAMSERVDELNRQISQLTSQLAQVRVEREEQVTEMDRLQQTHRAALANRMELESAKEGVEQQARKLSAELDEARGLKDANVDLKARLDKVISQRDEAMETHSEQETRLTGLQRQLDELDRRSDEHDDLRRSYLQLQTQANDSADRLRRITVERDSQGDALRNAESRLGQLEARSKANEETIRNLRRERATVIASNARQPATLAFSSVATRSVPEQDSGGRMRRDEVLGMVYTQPPKRKDDLKRISGIAQVLEKKLNAFGVYTYRQIMEWDNVAIAEFSKLLSFRDRIERDDWIGQARNLQYETYGRAA